MTVTEQRLYSLEEAEMLYDDPASCYETEADWIDGREEHAAGRSFKIEEWTVRPPITHLPSHDTILDWIDEWVADNGEIVEEVAESWTRACRSSGAIVAADRLRSAIASNVTGRMADRMVATHTITWDVDGNPLYDGEPLYMTKAAS